METLRTSIVAPTATPASHLQNKTDAKAKESIAKIQPPLFYQPKLTIGAPDDVYEKEADAMADKVMRMPMPEPINFSTAMNVVNRKCTECKEEEKLQRKEKRDEDDDKILMKSENTSYTGKAAPSIVHDVINTSGGKSLDPDTRSFMEPRFGYDFSNVKIHDNPIAAKSANSINALAYTSGNNVVFNSGQYNTNSDSGKRLLAHELTHVVQQGNGISAKVQRAPVAPVPCAVGKEAEKMAGTIQPVIIADNDGKNPTTAPSFAQVIAIWEKCCIDYTVEATKTIKKTDYKILDESPTNVPTAEESSLFSDAGVSNSIQVFVPQTFAQGGKTGKTISGGGGTYDAGTANPKIVVVEGAASEVVAHEVGHASGYLNHDANKTVMKPTGAYNVPNSKDVSADVCSKSRTGPVLKKVGAKKDCCMKY